MSIQISAQGGGATKLNENRLGNTAQEDEDRHRLGAIPRNGQFANEHGK